MKEEARYTITGTVASKEEVKGLYYLLVNVERGKNKSLFRIMIDNNLAPQVQRIKKGARVLVTGSLWGRRNERGYMDFFSVAENIFYAAGTKDEPKHEATQPADHHEPRGYHEETEDIPF